MHAQSARLVSLVRALGLVVGVTPAFAASPQPPSNLTTPPYFTQHVDRKSCDLSRFSLEVPVSAAGFNSAFESRFASAFSVSPSWFDCAGCTAFRARLTPVLQNLSSGALTEVPYVRRDGHRRGFVVHLEQQYKGAWVPGKMRADQSCLLVAALRKATAYGQGVSLPTSWSPQPPVLVSRLCAMVAQDAEASLQSWPLEWANKRIGALPNQSLAKVDVALVDTGVPKDYRGALEVEAEREMPSFDRAAEDRHPHGAQMAALIRATAPNARIRSYRALDQNGMGSVSALARSVDDALFDRGWTTAPRGPLVVNLSVGAPPDFFRPTKLEGTGCQTWEDGSGEVLRYVFHVAAALEQPTIQHPNAVFIATASGNAPLEFFANSDTPWAYNAPTSRCGTGATLPASSSFFPAAFAETRSCSSTSTSTWLPIQPVGASTFADGRSALSRLGGTTRLYAPGERVYAYATGMPAPSPLVECGPGAASPARGFELPATVSGTSASTALVSAAAAHLMGVQPQGPLATGWQSRDLSRLLYLTGVDLCGSTTVDERRISVWRAQSALTSSSAACNNLRSCLRSLSHPVGPAIGPWTGPVCDAATIACLSPESPACGQEEPSWTDQQFQAVDNAPPECRRAWDAPWAMPPPPTDGGVFPLAMYPGLNLGSLGPQPANTGCPNCTLVVGTSPAGLWMRFELGDEFKERTFFTDMQLVFLNRDHRPLLSVPVGDGRRWAPGEVGRISIPNDRLWAYPGANLYDDLFTGRALPVLDMAVHTPDGDVARNVSTLAVSRR